MVEAAKSRGVNELTPSRLMSVDRNWGERDTPSLLARLLSIDHPLSFVGRKSRTGRLI